MSEARVYRVPWGWRVFFVLGGLFLVGIFAFGLNETLRDPSAAASQRITVEVCLAAFGLLSALVVAFGFRGALVLDTEGLRYRSLGRWRAFRWADLSGYRIPPKEARSLAILFGKDGRRKLTIPGAFERPAEVLQALAAKLPDLELEEARAENAQLRRERDLEIRSGRTPADIRPVRLLCRGLNAAALVALLAVLLRPAVLPRPVEIAAVALSVLVAPAACALRLARPEVVRFAGKRGSELPSLEFALVGGLIAPIVPAVRDYAVLSAGEPLTWSVLLGIAATFALHRADPSILKTRIAFVLLFVFCFVWAYGSLVSVNGSCDTRAGRAYSTRVLHKSASEHTNSVIVAPFGNVTGETDVDVPRRVFDALSEGDAVSIVVRSGALGFAWVAGVQPASGARGKTA